MSETIIGLLLPPLGTALGAAMVFLVKGEIKPLLQKVLMGFAAGVMIAASVWSLLIPAIDMAGESGTASWLPAVIGFLAGIGFLLALDSLIPHLHAVSGKAEGRMGKLRKSTMLVLAITLHNLPEGMAVGVVFAGMIQGQTSMSYAGALALAIGIAIQNFPEGAIVSMPLVSAGGSKARAFALGTMSGLVEPIGALLTILLASAVLPALPYVLSFAAGAMIYVVVEELIPDSQAGTHSNIATIGVALGFALMMVLDIALS